MITRQWTVLGLTMLAGATLMVAGKLLFGVRRPTTNIVVIAVDGLRADALSRSAGTPETPNMERLSHDGIHFASAFSHSPDTLPAHISFLAARHPGNTEVLSDGQLVPTDLTLFPDWLAEMGYQTRGIVGHAELNPNSTRRGIDRSFEYFSPSPLEVAPAEDVTKRAHTLLGGIDNTKPFFLYLQYSDPQAPYAAHGSVIHEASVRLDSRKLEDVRTSELGFWSTEVELTPGTHVLDIRSKTEFELESFRCAGPSYDIAPTYLEGEPGGSGKRMRIALQNKEDKPLSCELRLWLHDKPEVADIRWRYKKEVEAVDENIGALVNELRRLNLYDDCLIVLTAAHGESLGEHGIIGHGSSLYDELLRVPLIVKLPFAHRYRDRLLTRRARIARHIDVVPTILDVLHAPDLPGAEGRSLLESDEPRTVQAEAHGEDPRFALRDEQYKLIYRPLDRTFRLYNLITDPSELDDAFTLQGHYRQAWQQSLKELAKGYPVNSALKGTQSTDPTARASW